MSLRIPSLAIAVVSLVMSGCGFPPLGSWKLTFFGGGEDKGTLMTFDYDDMGVGCPGALPSDFSASVNGELAHVELGSPSIGEGWMSHCGRPELRVDRPENYPESMVLEMDLGGEQVVAELEAIGYKLGGQLVLGSGEPPRVGQRVQIAVDPGFDQMSWPSTGWAFMGTFGPSAPIAVQPPSEGGLLDVQLPDTLPPGQTHVRLYPERVTQFTRCEFSECGFHSEQQLVAKVAFEVVFETVQ